MPSSQDYLNATREHLTTAESYARISQEAERMRQQTPALSDGEAVQQAISHLYGDSAGGVSDQIARAADRMRAFHAAEEFMQAQDAFRNTGLKGIGSFDSDKNDSIRSLCATRNYLGHPEQVWTPLSDADISKAAKESLGQISGTLKTLQKKLDDPSSTLNRQQRAALSESIEHLQHMQADLIHLRSGPTPPSGLSTQDVEDATHLEEIRAGRNAKAAMHSGGADLKRDGTLRELSDRGNDLAHLDPKPEHSGALERVQNGAGLSSQLPRQAPDIGHAPANGHDPAPHQTEVPPVRSPNGGVQAGEAHTHGTALLAAAAIAVPAAELLLAGKPAAAAEVVAQGAAATVPGGPTALAIGRGETPTPSMVGHDVLAWSGAAAGAVVGFELGAMTGPAAVVLAPLGGIVGGAVGTWAGNRAADGADKLADSHPMAALLAPHQGAIDKAKNTCGPAQDCHHDTNPVPAPTPSQAQVAQRAPASVVSTN